MERIYEHRTLGRIGLAKLEITGKGKLALDGQELPEKSVEHFLNFALQSLQDAYAGADTLDAAKKAWQAKYDKIVAGTIGVRQGGGGEAIIMRFVRKVLRDHMTDASKAEYKALDATDRDDWLNAKYEGLNDDQQKRVMDAAEKLKAIDDAKKAEAKALSVNMEI